MGLDDQIARFYSRATAKLKVIDQPTARARCRPPHSASGDIVAMLADAAQKLQQAGMPAIAIISGKVQSAVTRAQSGKVQAHVKPESRDICWREWIVSESAQIIDFGWLLSYDYFSQLSIGPPWSQGVIVTVAGRAFSDEHIYHVDFEAIERRQLNVKPRLPRSERYKLNPDVARAINSENARQTKNLARLGLRTGEIIALAPMAVPTSIVELIDVRDRNTYPAGSLPDDRSPWWIPAKNYMSWVNAENPLYDKAANRMPDDQRKNWRFGVYADGQPAIILTPLFRTPKAPTRRELTLWICTSRAALWIRFGMAVTSNLCTAPGRRRRKWLHHFGITRVLKYS